MPQLRLTSNRVKSVVVLIKDIDQQFEGLRLSLGLVQDGMEVRMVVLNHEISCMDQAYRDNMDFFDELKGQRFSNNMENAENFDFQPATTRQIARILAAADLIIPI